MSTVSSRWDDERVDCLKRLWCQGLSASQIAAQLGGVSRNAVIGKVHRLGLSRPDKENTAEGVDIFFEHAFCDAANENLTTSEPTKDQESAAQAVDALQGYELLPSTPQEGSAELTVVGQSVSLMELNGRMCRWPLGDPASKQFRFCGQPVDHGTPYCVDHGRIAYQPASEKRRLQRIWSKR
jgi:GcrA cell cycle regulator